MTVALASVFAVGCELALDFDRTKIDGGAIDASFGDTATDDQTSPPLDGTAEAASDTGTDAGRDALTADAPVDAPADTGTDAADTGTDAGSDAQDAADGD